MPYQVQFVGLVCFVKHEGAIHALLPDGRYPPGGIPRHYAFISVAIAAVDESGTSWPEDERIDDDLQTLFSFPPSQIGLEGAHTTGTLRTYDQDSRLPRLSLYPNHITIDPYAAPTIAHIPIRNGKFEAFRTPGSQDNGEAALISQLDVLQHNGPITLTVVPHDQSEARRIKLRTGTEIAFVNIAEEDMRLSFSIHIDQNGDVTFQRAAPGRASRRSTPDAAQSDAPTPLMGVDNHFQLYGKLPVPEVVLGTPGATPIGIPESRSEHVFFQAGGPIGTTPRCSNTGCCTG